jgi:opacity protein-like surface antigen
MLAARTSGDEMKSRAGTISTMVAASLAVLLLLHARGAAAQSTPPSSGPPKAEVFLGYSYFRSVPSPAAGNRMENLNGGTASVAWNFSEHLALVGDFAGYGNDQLDLTGNSPNEPRTVDSGGTMFTYLGGPRLSFWKHQRVSPFAQVLFGGVHASSVTISNCSGAACTPLPSQNAFAMTAGGGLDIRLTHHFAIRIVQAEYMMTRFGSVPAGGGSEQNDLRLSSGLVFRFGGRRAYVAPANQSPMAACSTDGKPIYAGSGDSVAVHAQASDPDHDLLSYVWSADSGTVVGSGADVQWNSTGAAPGVHTVHLTVNDGRGGTAECSTDVRVDSRRSPTVSCTADRSSVAAGDPVQITAAAAAADNSPLTYSWSTTGGQIVGSGAVVQLDTSGLAAGRYTVTGHVNDGQSETADCSVHFDALAPAPTALELKLALHSIYFPTGRPIQQHPDGGLLASQEQTLITLATDFETYLQSKPDAHLILEGHADPRGSAQYNQELSERRVQTAKKFLIERGIPAANIETKAFGLQRNLTDAEVREAVENSPELNPAQREQILDHSSTIILASNRRVDITLNLTGQRSIREYPFNAADSLTLLNPGESHSAAQPGPRTQPKPIGDHPGSTEQ